MTQVVIKGKVQVPGASWLHHAATALLWVALVVIGAVSGPVQAVASCATSEGLRSQWSFEGVVTAVRSKERIATVRTDDGRTVEVRGGSSRAVTSVDRTFEAGGRYEFHPINRSSPFEDNACTATRLLSRGPVPSSSRAWPVALLAGAAAAVLAFAVLSSTRRSRQHPVPTVKKDSIGDESASGPPS